MSHKLQVTPYAVDRFGELAPVFEEGVFDYVSLFNGETHGAPALVAPGREQGQNVPARATIGDSVLYINTSLIPLMEIERIETDD